MCRQSESLAMVREAACLLSAACMSGLEPAVIPLVLLYDSVLLEPVPEGISAVLDRLE